MFVSLNKLALKSDFFLPKKLVLVTSIYFNIQFAFMEKLDNNDAYIFDSIFTIFEKSTEGLLSGLREFLTIESPFKMMKNVFYLI